jgi:hypothetical protein
MLSSKSLAKSSVGLTISVGLDGAEIERANTAAAKTLSHFPWLKLETVRHGETTLTLWGRNSASETSHVGDDGWLNVLVGEPAGQGDWKQVSEFASRIDVSAAKPLKWKGRCLLVRVSPDGKNWIVQNDFGGSVPFFWSNIGNGRIASTLEPVCVAANDYSSDALSMPGLASVLILNHLVDDWTLFKGMKRLRTDVVAEWTESGFQDRLVGSIAPTDIRWDRGWDELADELFEVSRVAIRESVASDESWLVALSGGLDSRLVAAEAVAAGRDLEAFTYGPKSWADTNLAAQIAKHLGIPIKRIEIGTNFLSEHSGQWADWFGGSVGFHGMYQIPGLSEHAGDGRPILMGYIGDVLAGLQVNILADSGSGGMLDRMAGQFGAWSPTEVRRLLRGQGESAVDALTAELESQFAAADGADFQKSWAVFWRNHVSGFSTYQPMMYDYYSGVGTPYIHQEYAQFWTSVSRLALEDRRLQMHMVRRHYPELSAIRGTWGRPLRLTSKFLMRAAIGKNIPEFLRVGPFREFSNVGNTSNADALNHDGRSALWPIESNAEQINEILDLDMVDAAYEKAREGSVEDYQKLEPARTVALRLIGSGD